MWLVSVISTEDSIPGEELQRCFVHLVYSPTPEPTHRLFQPLVAYIGIVQHTLNPTASNTHSSCTLNSILLSEEGRWLASIQV